MRRFLLIGIAVLGIAFSAVAQDAAVGKEYDITIETEQNNQYTGAFGQAKIGSVVFDVPNAKKDQKYHVHVTGIGMNQYTGDKQASCDFQQTGGDAKGMCIPAP
jgi:hypothetical protein